MLAGDVSARMKLIDQVRASGIDHLFIADHVSFHNGAGMDGIVNAATLAALAPDLNVFIGVYLLALRHPVTVARQLSSISHSAPGRITLGVGIGGEDRHEMEICGVDPARRGIHTTHALRALRGLMRGEPVSYQCEFFEFDQALIKPPPRPAIPLVVGGRADAAIERAALHGDGWLGIWSSADRYRETLQRINDIAETHGREPLDWQHGLQLWIGVGDTNYEARSHVARGMEKFYHVPFAKFERYSPFGTPQAIADYLSPYVEAGCRTFNISPRGPSDEYCIEALASVAEKLKQACT